MVDNPSLISQPSCSSAPVSEMSIRSQESMIDQAGANMFEGEWTLIKWLRSLSATRKDFFITYALKLEEFGVKDRLDVQLLSEEILNNVVGPLADKNRIINQRKQLGPMPTNPIIEDWSVAKWLSAIGLGMYVELFEAQGYERLELGEDWRGEEDLNSLISNPIHQARFRFFHQLLHPKKQ